ncbi:MAG: AAA family ATPase [Turicibacter sp.]
MNGWEVIEEKQPEVARFLMNSYKKGRLVHAYILEGPQGVGKMEVGKNLAKLLMCESEDGVCGTCRHCLLIESEGHVNVQVIRPEGQSIKKEQIQALQSEFSKMAAEECAKVYIIEDADKMSSSAANSLLKFLEEPMPATYAILLTNNKQKLLPTIRSRAVTLSFKSSCHQALVKKYEEAGIKSNAAIIATLSQNIDEGLELAQSDSFIQMVDLVIKTEDCYIKTQLDPSILISGQSELLKDKKIQLLYLKLMMIYYEDILRLKLGKEEDIRFKMNRDHLNKSEELNSQSDCIRKLKALLETEKRLIANGNVLLCFDQLFLQMKGGY